MKQPDTNNVVALRVRFHRQQLVVGVFDCVLKKLSECEIKINIESYVRFFRKIDTGGPQNLRICETIQMSSGPDYESDSRVYSVEIRQRSITQPVERSIERHSE